MDSPFGIQLHHPQFLEWVGHRNLPVCSAGLPESGSGSCPGSKPYTLCSSSNVTLTSWPQILTFFSSTPLACTVQSVFGRHYFPSTAVHDAALVPTFIRPLCTWPPWVSGAHHLGLVVQDLQSFIRAPVCQVPSMWSAPVRYPTYSTPIHIYNTYIITCISSCRSNKNLWCETTSQKWAWIDLLTVSGFGNL